MRYHISNYKLFYAIATLSLSPVWKQLKVIALFESHNLSSILLFRYYDITILYVLIAIGLKDIRKLPKVFNRVVLFSTIVGQIYLAFSFIKFGTYNFSSITILLVTEIIYCFWVAVYFFTGDFGLIDKSITKKGAVFFLVMGISLYITMFIPVMLTEYQITIIPFSSGLFINTWTPFVLSISIVVVIFLVFLGVYIWMMDNIYKKTVS